MAENSLQNQKNEVSFILSDNAKAIIEKFEERLHEGNYTAEKRNGIRAELVWKLLGKKYPESVKKAENYVLQVCSQKYDIENISHYFPEDKSFFPFGLVFLYLNLNIPNAQHVELMEKEQLELLYDEVNAVIDYYMLVIFNYDAYYTFFKEKWYEKLCHGLYEPSSNTAVELYNNYLAYPLFWLCVSTGNLSECSNSIHYVLNRKFDLVILEESKESSQNCSFNLWRNKFALQSFIEDHLAENGTIFYKAPDININKTSWNSFRNWIVENRFLKGVIQLPRTKDGNTNQILVICKRPSDSIYFVDVQSDLMNNDQIDVDKVLKAIYEKNEYCYKELSFNEFISGNSQYYTFVSRQLTQILDSSPIKGELVELRELINMCDSEIERDVNCFFLNSDCYYWDLSSYLKSGVHYLEPLSMPLAKRTPNEPFFMCRMVIDLDELACSYLTKDKFSYFDWDEYANGISYKDVFTDEDNQIVYTYADSFIFQLRSCPAIPIDPYYLLNELMSTIVSMQIESFDHTDKWMSIGIEDFLSIKLVVPSVEEQQRIVSLERQKALADTREEIKKNFESYKQDIRMKKHALAQTLRVMKGWWMNLQMAREKGNGVIDDTATIGQLHPVAIKDIFGNIDHEMNMLFKQVNSFNMGDTMKVDVFDAKDFIQQYVNHHDPMFEYQCELPEKAANIRFPKEAFQIILDNISSNACSHGFKGREKEKNIIRIIAEIKGQDLIIRVDNNGRPMPVEMTAEKVFTYGDTTEEGSDEHGGLGGYLIKDMMTKFGGEVELELNAEADFPVAYKLVFRDVNIYK